MPLAAPAAGALAAGFHLTVLRELARAAVSATLVEWRRTERTSLPEAWPGHRDWLLSQRDCTNDCKVVENDCTVVENDCKVVDACSTQGLLGTAVGLLAGAALGARCRRGCCRRRRDGTPDAATGGVVASAAPRRRGGGVVA